MTSTDFSSKRFYYVTPLTLTSFKAMVVTLKYARFLEIRNMALYKERTILIVSKFQYIQCIGSRPVKLKPIPRGILCKHPWNAVFCLIHFSVSQRWHSFKWFSYFKWRIWGYFKGEIRYGNFKMGCITCKWTSKRPEEMFQIIFVYIYAM